MRIVIIGAGAVGSFLAERLSGEGQDIVVIESDPIVADRLQNTVDCLVIVGNGASPTTLEQAGLRDAGLLIAVTTSDAVNILACHAANRFGVEKKVARVTDPGLRDEIAELGVDFIIDPEEAAARELLLITTRGGVSELSEFADGRLLLMGAFIDPEASIVGTTLAELRLMVEGWDWLVVAIVRDTETMIARGSTVLEADDHVLLMAKSGRTEEASRLLELRTVSASRVVVLGGTRIAKLTIDRLIKAGVSTTVVDGDSERCFEIAEQQPKATVICGDPTDPKILRAEGVAGADAVLALTGWDDRNILGCLMAKDMGVPMTVARLRRLELGQSLPAGVGIDATVSSRLAAASEIARFVRRGNIHSVVTFQDSAAEAIELEVGPNSSAVGKTLADLKLPHSLIVGGVQRGDDAFVPRGSTVIAEGDHLIVIALPDAIGAAEQLSG